MNHNLKTVLDQHYEPDGRAKLKREVRRESYWIDVAVLVAVVIFLLMLRIQ